jgi:galactose mutarotase-like enzyme
MELHGFLKACEFTLTAGDSPHAVTATWESRSFCSEDSEWPFSVRVDITIEFVGECLRELYVVTSLDDQPVPFSIGNHVSLAIHNWDATVVRSLGPTELCCARLNSAFLVEPPVEALPAWINQSGGGKITLESSGISDGEFLGCVAAFHDPWADEKLPTQGTWSIEVVQPTGTATISHEHPVIKGGEASSERAAAAARGCCFVFWGTRDSTSQHGFLCPEPWVGLPDSLNSGIGRVDLLPGETAHWAWSVCWKRE